ncbi:histidine phosphatase family protein [Roseobacter sp.]|uniref:histidine phosphatase family protein n=1 Tax=Roseobacter sp. TaxID=1907202 RepID=UPI00329911B8
MMRLGVLRHGHTPWNRAGRIQGRTDVALDAAAETALAQLRLPAPWDTAALWASPLSRARRTAELVAARTPNTTPALTEMDWGTWEGQHGKTLRADTDSGFRDIETWGWDYRPPGGESPAEVRARLMPWVAALHTDTVAVCHIGIMRVLLAQATGWAFEGPAPFQIKRNRLYVITLSGDDWHLEPSPVRLEARAP